MRPERQNAKAPPLILSAKRRTWRQADDAVGLADAEFRRVEKTIVERDGFSCRFCTFRDVHGHRSPRYIGVHHLDDDHANNAPDNLLTACHPCHMCHHIGYAGMSGDYALAWVPELPQTMLIHLSRSCLVASHYAQALEQGQVSRETRETVTALANAANSVVDELSRRREEARRIYQTDDLTELGNALLVLGEDAYRNRHAVLGGLRLLPLGTLTRGGVDVMPKIVERWLVPRGPFHGLKPPSWLSLFADASRRIGGKSR